MNEYNCPKVDKGFCAVSIIIAIIIGVIVGILFTSGAIVDVAILAGVSLVLAGVSLLIQAKVLTTNSIAGKCNELERCVRTNNLCLLISTIGTIILGTGLLSATLVATEIISILLVGFTAFFAIWMLLSIASLLYCLIK